jgi:hypothetical protein
MQITIGASVGSDPTPLRHFQLTHRGLAPPLHSLSHSGLFQAASAFRKTFNLTGRNFRFE